MSLKEATDVSGRSVVDDRIWDSFIQGYSIEWYKEVHKQGVYPYGKEYVSELLKTCDL